MVCIKFNVGLNDLVLIILIIPSGFSSIDLLNPNGLVVSSVNSTVEKLPNDVTLGPTASEIFAIFNVL